MRATFSLPISLPARATPRARPATGGRLVVDLTRSTFQHPPRLGQPAARHRSWRARLQHLRARRDPVARFYLAASVTTESQNGRPQPPPLTPATSAPAVLTPRVGAGRRV